MAGPGIQPAPEGLRGRLIGPAGHAMNSGQSLDPRVTGEYRYDPRRFSPVNIVIREVAAHFHSAPAEVRVLDAGCGGGWTARELKRRGNFAVYGVEKDPAAAAEAKNHCREVAVLDLERPGLPPFADPGFDAILFVDVLEHLKDPRRVLSDFKKLLRPAGIVAVSLPNVAHLSVRLSLLAGRFEYRPSGILDRNHLRFFTARTGRKLIEAAGFEVFKFVFGSSRLGGLLKFAPRLGGALGYNLVYFARPGQI